MADNNCPDCLRSGVGACDDFPGCQPIEPEFKFSQGQAVTVLTADEEVSFIGMYVGETSRTGQRRLIVLHGDPHTEDPMLVVPEAVKPDWPPMAAWDDYFCATCIKERKARKDGS